MNDNSSFNILFQKFINGSINRSEYIQLVKQFEDDANHTQVSQYIQDQLVQEVGASNPDVLSTRLQKVDAQLKAYVSLETKKSTKLKRYYPYLVAAILLLVGSFSFLYFKTVEKNSRIDSSALTTTEIGPGTNKATILLEDGRKFSLHDIDEGIAMSKHGIHYANGQRIVRPSMGSKVTIQTPRGGEYHVVLADGTKVHVNAASNLRYPVEFAAEERIVELEGEAYFEVAHDQNKPFIVRSGNQEIKVLGTKFNLNSYQHQQQTTTLLAGSVEVRYSPAGTAVILKPGEQARAVNQKISIHAVNPDDYIGWTRGIFVFNDLRLSEIMKEIALWYDIEVFYPTDFVNERFFAEIPRRRKLSEVLKALEKAGNYKFDLKGRRVMVHR